MSANPVLALKVDVDTERGTREGVPALVRLLEQFGIPATFLFSLGPDNTGRAITRIFRPGFFKKVSRTSVLQTYGLRTLLSGTFLPAPHIGQRHAAILRDVQQRGFEVGIHCYDHYRWQDHLFRFSLEETREQFRRARGEFFRIFGSEAHCAGAPGWQASEASKQIYDEAGLLYASDSRGSQPFFPKVGERIFRTLEIPTTLPTFDELLGRPSFPDEMIPSHYMGLLRRDRPNVMTIHAEIEGGFKRRLFESLIRSALDLGCSFVPMEDIADEVLEGNKGAGISPIQMGMIDGRSGTLALQGGVPA